MKLYKSTKLDSMWVIFGTFFIALFVMAGTGCQTFSGFSNQEDGGKMSLKDAPSRKRQPRTLESLVRTQDELPSLPPSMRSGANYGDAGIDIDDVALKAQSVHVEADLSIEEIANSDKQQLPAILESPAYPFRDIQPPVLTPDAFEQSSNESGGARHPAKPIAFVQATRSPSDAVAPVSVAPVSVAPDQQQTTSPPRQAPATTSAVTPSTGMKPVPGGPILTLTAKSQSGAGALLSDEIESLLGPVTSPELPDEFDPNSLASGEQMSNSHARPLNSESGSDGSTAEQLRIQEANRISGVEHAAWAGPNPTHAAQIGTMVETTAPITADQDMEGQPRQLTWQEQLRASIDLLDNQIRTQENAESAAIDSVRMQLLEIVAGTSGGQPFNVTGLPDNQAAFWQHQLSSIQVMLNGTPDEDIAGNEAALQRRRATTAARQLELAANQLAGDASLQVTNAIFCNQVRGFGQFEAASNVFVPSQQTLIYCEIDNYVLAELQTDAEGQDSQMAELRGQFVIVDENGQVVHQHQYQSVQDKTRWRRKDFYMYFPLTFPQLATGRYRLQLSIEDMIGQKFASVHPDLEFTIAPAQPRNSTPQQKTADGSIGGSVR